MTLKSLMEDYLRYVLHERGLSVNTHKSYQSQLRHYHKWLTENGYPEPEKECLAVTVLRRYLYYLSEKGLRPRTIRSYFDPLEGLGEYFIEHKMLEENPVKKLTMPQLDAARRDLVSNEEVYGLLEAVERGRNPRKVALSRALLNIVIFSGLRRSEFLDLRMGDLNLKDKSLLVRSGKGSKSRTIYLPDRAIESIREYLVFRPQDCSHDFLLAVDRKRRLYDTSMLNILENVKTVAGFGGRDNIKPHSLRHWRATDLLRAGADLKTVSAFLGHAQLQTTSIYLHTNEEQCRGIAELSMLPEGKIKRENVPSGSGLSVPYIPEEKSPRERARFRRQSL